MNKDERGGENVREAWRKKVKEKRGGTEGERESGREVRSQRERERDGESVHQDVSHIPAAALSLLFLLFAPHSPVTACVSFLVAGPAPVTSPSLSLFSSKHKHKNAHAHTCTYTYTQAHTLIHAYKHAHV